MGDKLKCKWIANYFQTWLFIALLEQYVINTGVVQKVFVSFNPRRIHKYVKSIQAPYGEFSLVFPVTIHQFCFVLFCLTASFTSSKQDLSWSCFIHPIDMALWLRLLLWYWIFASFFVLSITIWRHIVLKSDSESNDILKFRHLLYLLELLSFVRIYF